MIAPESWFKRRPYRVSERKHYSTSLDHLDHDLIARVEELPGCAAHGSDETQAINNLRKLMKALGFK